MIRELHKYEFTGILEDKVWHYTCNSPNLEILNKYDIDAIGEDYGCDPREILLIPKSVYGEFGLLVREEDITVLRERLLTKLE